MKLKKKILTGVLAVSMACIILQPNKANAALQANGGTAVTNKINDWILLIRQMQELGGTLGRADTINTTNLKSNVTDLDIHLQKNTEYGAMAILSASAYGNPNPVVDTENTIGTTTGNSTGIIINLNGGEFTAAAISSSDIPNLQSAAERYKNIYSSNAKVGDALTETQGWHNATASWFVGTPGAMLRSREKSIFSYSGNGNSSSGVAGITHKRNARACIVVGTGI